MLSSGGGCQFKVAPCRCCLRRAVLASAGTVPLCTNILVQARPCRLGELHARGGILMAANGGPVQQGHAARHKPPVALAGRSSQGQACNSSVCTPCDNSPNGLTGPLQGTLPSWGGSQAMSRSRTSREGHAHKWAPLSLGLAARTPQPGAATTPALRMAWRARCRARCRAGPGLLPSLSGHAAQHGAHCAALA